MRVMVERQLGVALLLLSTLSIGSHAQQVEQEHDDHEVLFSSWLQHHPRSYDDPRELAARYKNFEHSVQRVDRLRKLS